MISIAAVTTTKERGIIMYFKSLDELRNYVNSTSFLSSEQLMIMVGDKSADLVPDMMQFLNSRHVSFFGGIFAGLIVGNKKKSEGFIVEKLEPIYSSLVFPYMMRFSQDLEKMKGATALVFVDGLSSRMKDLTDTIQEKLGNEVTYVGGGAGFYDLKHRPCIFNSRDVYKDALYVCIVKKETKLAVEHGWNKLQGPFFVKRSYDNILSELDVYKDHQRCR